MSPRELTERLIASLENSARLLAEMERGLCGQRTSWVSARPSVLARPAHAPDGAARELAAEEARRGELLAKAQALLPPAPGLLPGARRVDIGRVAAQVPEPAAGKLRAAARAAADAARAVRGEVALGQRLLAFAQRVQEGLLGDYAQQRADFGGYDRNARRQPVHRAGTRSAGNLIDGRL
jgi:hypothetical protein